MFDPQLASELHQIFVQVQELLCSLIIEKADPFKASPRPEDLAVFRLQAITSYRAAILSHLSRDELTPKTRSYLEAVQSLLYILHHSMISGRPKAIISDPSFSWETWIDECFPVVEPSSAIGRDFWTSIYRYAMRRRFDSVCLLLQRLLDDPLSRSRNMDSIQAITEILLAYPTAKQRSLNPYALGQWQLELQSRLRTENVSAWDSNLVNVLTLVEGQSIPPSIRAAIDSWQELFVGHIVLSVQQPSPESVVKMLKDCMAEKPSSAAVLDQMVLGLVQGSPELNRLAEIDMIGPHIIDLFASLSPALAENRNVTLITYGKQLMSESGLWNLGADYLWMASEEGRQELERRLFQMAKSASPCKQRCIIDLCRNFDMHVLADAILVMISEAYLAADSYSKALSAAIEAGQPSLVTRVCDAVLRQAWSVVNLEVIDGASLDCSGYPRLSLLVAIVQLQRYIDEGNFEAAASTLINSVFSFEDSIPEFIRPQLLSVYLRLAPSLPENQTPPLKVLLEFINSHASGMTSEAAIELRQLLVHQAANTFLQL